MTRLKWWRAELTSRFSSDIESSTCNSLFGDPRRTGLPFSWPRIVPGDHHGTPQQNLPSGSLGEQTPLFLFLLCVWPANTQNQHTKIQSMLRKIWINHFNVLDLCAALKVLTAAALKHCLFPSIVLCITYYHNMHKRESIESLNV